MSFFSKQDILSGEQPAWVRASRLGASPPLDSMIGPLRAARDAIRAANVAGRAARALADADALLERVNTILSTRHQLGRNASVALRDLLQGLLSDAAYYIQHTNLQRQVERLGTSAFMSLEEVEQFRHNPGGSINRTAIVLSHPEEHGSVRYYRGQRIDIDEAKRAVDEGIVGPGFRFRPAGNQFRFTRDLFEAGSSEEFNDLFRNAPPVREVDGFGIWVNDLLRAFEDVGDPQRPVYGPGERLGGMVFANESASVEDLYRRINALIDLFASPKTALAGGWGVRLGADVDPYVIVVEQGTSPYREGTWLTHSEAAFWIENHSLVVREPVSRDYVQPGKNLLGPMLDRSAYQRNQYPPSLGALPDFTRLSTRDLIPGIGSLAGSLDPLISFLGTNPARIRGLEDLSEGISAAERELLQHLNAAIETLQALKNLMDAPGISRLWIPLQDNGTEGIKEAIRRADPTRRDLQRVTHPGFSDYRVGDTVTYEEAYRVQRSVGGGFSFRPVENLLVGGVGIFYHPGPLATFLERLFRPEESDVDEFFGDAISVNTRTTTVDFQTTAAGAPGTPPTGASSPDNSPSRDAADAAPRGGESGFGDLDRATDDEGGTESSAAWSSTPAQAESFRHSRRGPVPLWDAEQRVFEFAATDVPATAFSRSEVSPLYGLSGVPLLGLPHQQLTAPSTSPPTGRPGRAAALPVGAASGLLEERPETALPALWWETVSTLAPWPTVSFPVVVEPGGGSLLASASAWQLAQVEDSLPHTVSLSYVARDGRGRTFVTRVISLTNDRLFLDRAVPAAPAPAAPAGQAHLRVFRGASADPYLLMMERGVPTHEGPWAAEIAVRPWAASTSPEPPRQVLQIECGGVLVDSDWESALPNRIGTVQGESIVPPPPAGYGVADLPGPSHAETADLFLGSWDPVEVLSNASQETVRVAQEPSPEAVRRDRGLLPRKGWAVLTAQAPHLVPIGCGTAGPAADEFSLNADLTPAQAYVGLSDGSMVELEDLSWVVFIGPHWEVRPADIPAEHYYRPVLLLCSATEGVAQFFPEVQTTVSPGLVEAMHLLPGSEGLDEVSDLHLRAGSPYVGETSLLGQARRYGDSVGVPLPELVGVLDLPLSHRDRVVALRFAPVTDWQALRQDFTYVLWAGYTHALTARVGPQGVRLQVQYRGPDGWEILLQTAFLSVRVAEEYEVEVRFLPSSEAVRLIARRASTELADEQAQTSVRAAGIDGLSPPDGTLTVGLPAPSHVLWAGQDPPALETPTPSGVDWWAVGTPPLALLSVTASIPV